MYSERYIYILTFLNRPSISVPFSLRAREEASELSVLFLDTSTSVIDSVAPQFLHPVLCDLSFMQFKENTVPTTAILQHFMYPGEIWGGRIFALSAQRSCKNLAKRSCKGLAKRSCWVLLNATIICPEENENQLLAARAHDVFCQPLKKECKRFPGLFRVYKWGRDQDFYLHATNTNNLPWSSGEDGGVGAADPPGPDNEEATVEINGVRRAD